MEFVVMMIMEPWVLGKIKFFEYKNKFRFVFASMGFYPLSGSETFIIGSPLFKSVKIINK